MHPKPVRDESFDRLFKQVLLPSESRKQFKSIRTMVYEELAPRTPIEHFLVREVVLVMHDLERLHRFRTGVLNNAFLSALQNLIEPTSPFAGLITDPLVQNYFSSVEARKNIEDRLASLGLKTPDIEAEAFRIRAEPLESINKQLACNESRLRTLLRSLQKNRVRFPGGNNGEQGTGAHTGVADVACRSLDEGKA
jgi:hypothetical protein